MKRVRWLQIVLILGIAAGMVGKAVAGDWGVILHAKPNTLLRSERSTAQGTIKGALKGGQAVKADFLRDGWYAVFEVTEPDRDESKAMGYVYASRLYAPPANQKTGQEIIEPKAAGKQASEGVLPPLEVKDIRFQLDPDGQESIYIVFNRFYTPSASSLPGQKPRIVLDIAPIMSLSKEWATIPADGRYIKSIRTYLNRKTRSARIVIDMDPTRNFAVQPVFSEKDQTYVLQVREDRSKTEEKPPKAATP